MLALWTLFFLAALAVALGAYVSSGLRLAEELRADTLGWCAAHAGVERACYEVSQDTNEWDALSEPWASDPQPFLDVELGAARYRVTWLDRGVPDQMRERPGVRDEDGKLNVRLAETNQLAALFQAAGGLDAPGAGGLAQEVARYRNLPMPWQLTDSQDSDYADRQDAGNGLRLASLHELRGVAGMTDDLFARIEPYITVYTGDGKVAHVNLNTADPPVVEALGLSGGAEDAAALAALLQDFRQSGGVLKAGPRGMPDLWRQLREFDPGRDGLRTAFVRLGGGRVTTRSSVFSGTAEGWVGDRTNRAVRVRFVFDRRTGARRLWEEE